jgi:hypothetical protein
MWQAHIPKIFRSILVMVGVAPQGTDLGGEEQCLGRSGWGLIILTSSGRKDYSVSRDASEDYCREGVKRNFEGLTGNKRWIAALYSEFL